MTILQAVILGIVQGITEFFPISSSGHLVILQGFFGLKEPQLAFDIFLHFGTLISVLVFFRDDIINLFKKDMKWLFYLVLGSIPTFIIALLLEDTVEKLFAMPRLVGGMLILTGVYLISASIFAVRIKTRRGLNALNSLIIGVSQGLAVIPGISRTGITIATGIMCGLGRTLSFRFTFLLSILSVSGANILKFQRISEGITGKESPCFMLGAIAAMLAGLVALKVFLKLIQDNKLYLFGIYCIFAGGFIVVSLW